MMEEAGLSRTMVTIMAGLPTINCDRIHYFPGMLWEDKQASSLSVSYWRYVSQVCEWNIKFLKLHLAIKPTISGWRWKGKQKERWHPLSVCWENLLQVLSQLYKVKVNSTRPTHTKPSGQLFAPYSHIPKLVIYVLKYFLCLLCNPYDQSSNMLHICRNEGVSLKMLIMISLTLSQTSLKIQRAVVVPIILSNIHLCPSLLHLTFCVPNPPKALPQT
jgi:hypothetical protein